ncbi:hypothetical protein [Thioalkalivibrio denitrificans]|nr:hypothetical protein [Thioalkalivibrio denitrificans]
METIYEQHERMFLEAWKHGVRLAGPEYFNVLVPDVDAATDKNQRRPNREAIEAVIDALGSGESVFLDSMYSFYNSEVRHMLLESLDRKMVNICDIAAALDGERKEVIGDLLRYYPGW